MFEKKVENKIKRHSNLFIFVLPALCMTLDLAEQKLYKLESQFFIHPSSSMKHEKKTFHKSSKNVTNFLLNAK